MCCKLMGVAAIGKAPHAWCGHYRKGAGCGIYADRPQACADYACYWRNAPNLDDLALRSNTIVVFSADHGAMLGSQAKQAKQKPWDESIRVPLNVLVGRRGYTILADRDIDQGLVREIPA